MHLRLLVPVGFALFIASGCQSYFPYGYGQNGAYPALSGTYIPSGTVTPAKKQPPANLQGEGSSTPQGGQLNNSAEGQTRAQSPKEQDGVPKYSDPGKSPANLGTPTADDDDEPDSIRRGQSSHDRPAKRIDDSGDESNESVSSLEGEKFVTPVSASDDEVAPARTSSKSRASPYKKDPNGYKWLRGVVARDPKSDAWRITYSRDSFDDDPYHGSLTLVADPMFDTLVENDVVLVEGDVVRAMPDKYGKPSYRARRVRPLQPKDD